MFLSGEYLRVHTASQPKTLPSSPQWEPHILQHSFVLVDYKEILASSTRFEIGHSCIINIAITSSEETRLLDISVDGRSIYFIYLYFI